MERHVCPWWIGYLLLSPVRRWGQSPATLLGPYVGSGMTVLDVGCAMGFFTLDLARLVGEKGRVIAVDLQPRMIRTLERRARRAGLDGRIETRVCEEDSLAIEDLRGAVDFALAFAVAHEVPDARRFMEQLGAAINPNGRLLVAEPAGHVNAADFEKTIEAAVGAGFEVVERPTIRRSRAALLAAGG
jgi:SAM-dependent methyltransferase